VNSALNEDIPFILYSGDGDCWRELVQAFAKYHKITNTLRDQIIDDVKQTLALDGLDSLTE